MALLKLVGVEKSFGGVKAVDGVDMEVGQEWVAVVGPNGAGKTTLVNIISGFVKPDRGRVLFKGVDVTRRGPAERVKMGIVRAFQLPLLFPNKSVQFNVEVAVAARRGLSLRPMDSAEVEELLREFGLWEKRERSVEELSEGDKKLLDVLLAVALRPSLILLDEPTSSVSEADKIPLMEYLAKKLSGVAAIIVEHDLDIVKRFATRVVVMSSGRVVAVASPQEADKYVL